MSWHVYTLSEPDTGAVRYVGATKLRVSLRRSLHMVDARRGKPSPVNAWIRGLLGRWVQPQAHTVETIEESWTQGLQDTREADWIGRHLATDARLLNMQSVLRAKAMHGLDDPALTPGARALYSAMNAQALSVADVAAALGISAGTVHNWLTAGFMPAPALRLPVERWSEGAVPTALWAKPAAEHRARA